MKKIVFLLAFFGFASLVQAKTSPESSLKTAIPTLQDSVVIEFGKAGKIVITVASKEDFEKLKLMNINQIISELDLEENKETGELTLVEIHKKDGTVKEVVKVIERPLETEVQVGKMRVYVDESGENTKVKIETGSKEDDPPFVDNFSIDLGINNFLQEGSFPTSDQPYATKGWGSWNVGLNWVGSHRIGKGVQWNLGVGFQWYNFKFENRDFQAIRGRDQIAFVERTDVTGIKSKLSASYLTAMTLLEVNLGKSTEDGFTLAAGPYLGYRLGGRSKFVFDETGGSRDKIEKVNTGLYLENLRYGIRGELGIGEHVTFFTTYDLNTLFQDGKGPSLNPITFGIVF